ncbi:Indolepyruvate oxidoreductase subunit IorA [Candidatus Methanoperedenaceae archaeon GB50]|nr:Indolepyruvate oxidoreductase subunit IorA [Candidatus Methanoperedenaceae archaeon GB50]CAD7773855.1 MAG: Indolepyruvate oxidoreductase subunit IorA [Candidatus Methanoperedenaceae archaeon GB50]
MMRGRDAIVWAVADSSVGRVVGVPGYPVTGIMEDLIESTVGARWCVNEKVAFESCIGASSEGGRGLVVTKHVGLNILADPLITSVTHTIGAGIVLLAGDDPGAKRSQNEQDSRLYGVLAEVPVFDPSTPQQVYDAIVEGYALSERIRTPVIVRVTERLVSMEGEVERRRVEASRGQVFDSSIWQYTFAGKHQLFHETAAREALEYAERGSMNRVEILDGRVGVISSGYLSNLVDELARKDGVSHLALGLVYPLPLGVIGDFIERHERVLVVEETEPFIEDQINGVLGKRTGHLPHGRIEVEHIRAALERIEDDRVEATSRRERIDERGYRIHPCEGCPFTPFYEALDALDLMVAGDVGCSVLMAPLGTVDVAVSLGSSIGVALGFNGKGVAVIGDFGLAHSGLQAIIDALESDEDLLVFVIQNHVAAMTGGQPAVDLRRVVSCMVGDVTVVEAEKTDKEAYRRIISEKLEENGVSIVFIDGRCPEGAEFQKIRLS